jgi:hypothetical protein
MVMWFCNPQARQHATNSLKGYKRRRPVIYACYSQALLITNSDTRVLLMRLEIMAQRTVNAAGDKHELDPERWTTTTEQSRATTHSRHPQCRPETGMGGLMTHWNGGERGTTLLGSSSDTKAWSTVVRTMLHAHMARIRVASCSRGDIIVMQPPAVSLMRHRPEMWRDMEQEHSGEHIYGPSAASFNDPEDVARAAMWCRWSTASTVSSQLRAMARRRRSRTPSRWRRACSRGGGRERGGERGGFLGWGLVAGIVDCRYGTIDVGSTPPPIIKSK